MGKPAAAKLESAELALLAAAAPPSAAAPAYDSQRDVQHMHHKP